ncbi:hypothetical protein SRABI83_03236 [Arthrobacter sp. Bi83]|nr:hypothetical protein SRABI83_03236 [Arthrobacter sp. Bi83]
MPSWRIVVTDGKERTAVWFCKAATKAEAERMALEEHPGWYILQADREL